MDMLAAFSPIIPQPENEKTEKIKPRVKKIFFIIGFPFIEKTTPFTTLFKKEKYEYYTFLVNGVSTKIECGIIIINVR